MSVGKVLEIFILCKVFSQTIKLWLSKTKESNDNCSCCSYEEELCTEWKEILKWQQSLREVNPIGVGADYLERIVQMKHKIQSNELSYSIFKRFFGFFNISS